MEIRKYQLNKKLKYLKILGKDNILFLFVYSLKLIKNYIYKMK